MHPVKELFPFFFHEKKRTLKDWSTNTKSVSSWCFAFVYKVICIEDFSLGRNFDLQSTVGCWLCNCFAFSIFGQIWSIIFDQFSSNCLHFWPFFMYFYYTSEQCLTVQPFENMRDLKRTPSSWSKFKIRPLCTV